MDRRKIVTLLVVLFTIGLAGVAVFTAVRLYQQREEPVAPTAPTSIPRAQEASPSPSPAASCAPVTFNLTQPTTPVCGDTCNPSDTSTCPTDHTCSTTTNKCVLTACTVAGANCDTNKCNVITTLQCGDTCGGANQQCPNDHTCSGGKCVLSQCLQSGVTCNSTKCTVTPASCNNTCSANQPCSSGLTCVSGSCRNPSCTNETDCTCTVAQATPTPTQTAAPTAAPSLPVAGTAEPTIIAGILGVLAIIGALAFAL